MSQSATAVRVKLLRSQPLIRWNRTHEPESDFDAVVQLTARSRDLHAFLDAKLNDLAVSLSRQRLAMTWLQDRATDDASLLGIVGTAFAAIRQQERSLAEIQQRLNHEPWT